MDGTNVEGDAAIIWRQAGREGGEECRMGGVRKNATAWTFKRTLERDGCWSVKMKGAKARVWRWSGRMQERYEWRKITK